MSGTSGTSDPVGRAYAGIPNWVGFGFVIAAGVVLLVVGAVVPSPGVVAFGVATVAAAIIAWVSGASAKPELNPFKQQFGGTVKEIKQVPWLVIFGLYVVAALVAIFAG